MNTKSIEKNSIKTSVLWKLFIKTFTRDFVGGKFNLSYLKRWRSLNREKFSWRESPACFYILSKTKKYD